MTSTIRTVAGGCTVGPDRAPVELLDVNTVASMLDCSARHVWRLADTGRMPCPVKLGQLRRWRRDELADWIAGGCQPVRSERGADR